MRKKLEQSDLSATDLAAIYIYIENHLKQGKWTSRTEMNDAMRNPAYHMTGSLGELFRAEWEAKGIRTQKSGKAIGGDNRVSDIMPRTATFGVARRNEDGEIETKITDLSNPTGNAPTVSEGQEPQPPIRVTHLAGGTVRAEVNRSGLPLIQRSAAEEAKHQAYLKRAREANPLPETYTRLPFIKKSGGGEGDDK